jgi:N-acylneuraminate cytidylyltransferase
MPNLCIIPARGGSKRIPRKNIKDFLGKPIIAYSIEVALNSGLFDEVMVSTDDKEIAEIAIKYGAKVPFFRSKMNSNDFATTFDVIEEVLNNYMNENIEFENSCIIYPCAPLLNIRNLKLAFYKLVNDNFDSVWPIVKFGNSVQRSFKTIGEKVVMFYPEFKNMRSQDLENAFYDPGQFYWIRNKSILSGGFIYSNNSSYIILDEIETQDIDNLNDWKLAEMKFNLLNKNEN